MRNVVTAILPPNHETTFEVKPPMRLTERPMVFTIRKLGMVIRQLSNSEVLVQNPTEHVMPVLFFVADNLTLNLIAIIKRFLPEAKEAT